VRREMQSCETLTPPGAAITDPQVAHERQRRDVVLVLRNQYRWPETTSSAGASSHETGCPSAMSSAPGTTSTARVCVRRRGRSSAPCRRIVGRQTRTASVRSVVPPRTGPRFHAARKTRPATYRVSSRIRRQARRGPVQVAQRFPSPPVAGPEPGLGAQRDGREQVHVDVADAAPPQAVAL
jgi:hypothetical protein